MPHSTTVIIACSARRSAWSQLRIETFEGESVFGPLGASGSALPHQRRNLVNPGMGVNLDRAGVIVSGHRMAERRSDAGSKEEV